MLLQHSSPCSPLKTLVPQVLSLDAEDTLKTWADSPWLSRRGGNPAVTQGPRDTQLLTFARMQDVESGIKRKAALRRCAWAVTDRRGSGVADAPRPHAKVQEFRNVRMRFCTATTHKRA